MSDVEKNRERICRAALHLAAERGWENVSLRDIAIRAEISLPDVYQVTSSKLQVLFAIQRYFNDILERSVEPLDQADTPRDRVFDVVMVSLEMLEPYRHGVESIYRGLLKDPLNLLFVSPAFRRSMQAVAAFAGLDVSGLKGHVTSDGLGLLWLNTFRVWLDDDGAELAKTMAELDKSLRRLEGVCERMANCRPTSLGDPTSGVFSRS